MIRLVLFDTGETLLSGLAPQPHVKEALAAISQFESGDGERLTLGIVSDFKMPHAPVTAAKIRRLEKEFEQILSDAGLSEFFSPFKSHVTLSSRAGVFKPDQKIFQLAIERSGTGATLGECLFVTETPEHLAACRLLGMSILRFGGEPGIQPSFAEWIDAPGIIAGFVGPSSPANRELAANVFLSARHGITNFRMTDTAEGSRTRGCAQQLLALKGSDLGPLDGVFVEVPTTVDVKWAKDGRIAEATVQPPDKEEVSGVRTFVTSLVRNRQVTLPGEKGIRATHEVTEDGQGRRRLIRRCFTAR